MLAMDMVARRGEKIGREGSRSGFGEEGWWD